MGKKSNFKREYEDLLTAQTHYGESKHKAKQEQLARDKDQNKGYEPVRGIYSKTTFKTYSKACAVFSAHLRKNHPSLKRFAQGREYIAEWLETLKDTHSAWTIATYAQALCCVYNIRKKDIAFDFPQRKRKNIVRSRGSVNFADTAPKFADAILFCKAVGARRCGILRVRKEDIRQKADGTYEVFLREKNKMSGWRQVLPQYSEEILRIFRESPGYKVPNGEMRVFAKNCLPSELHRYRAEYAKDLYLYYESHHMYETGQKYYCRGDMASISFDRGILLAVSTQLFHHRCDVVTTNYLYMFKN